jgi:hypothetical protein
MEHFQVSRQPRRRGLEEKIRDTLYFPIVKQKGFSEMINERIVHSAYLIIQHNGKIETVSRYTGPGEATGSHECDQ